MVQQMMDPKLNKNGLGTEHTSWDKQVLVDVKKTPLRDLQNDNRITKPNPAENSLFSKDRGSVINAIKVSGIKRPSARSPPRHQSPNSIASNVHLVYVRRKPEAELGKSSNCNGTRVTAEKSSARLSLGVHGMSSGPSESSHVPTSTIPPVSDPKRMKNVNWQERFQQLQILLWKLDQTDQEDYLQLLRSLSSVELSRHAVDLERRSIQLSLEEAKEMQRVAVLDVLGKSMKSFEAPLADQKHLGK